ncbi:response regulator transcription factor [Zhouia sp. PK063]|uniref:response regulator transcription factor n=1 Tax=Zhouia sp. PK063 TaxID=3373602 RepID=UPI0037949F77
MRVLIVEDEPGILSFLKQGLEEENYTVTAVNNGSDGLALALDHDFDIMILDWMLPNISGLEICKQVRKKNTAIPIIFLTAKDTVSDTIQGLQSGANDYIKKPFHFAELLERMKVQLRSQLNEFAILHLGPFSVNPNTHEVFKADQEIKLTLKEFALLAYLIKNKGIICNRKNILEEVWGIHFNYNSGIIDVYINAIRKKLNLSTEEEYIQTIRGVGYLAKEI